MLKKNLNLNNDGFTLVELLVSTSIFVIVALASLSIYAQTLKVSRKTLALTKVQTEAQFVMQVLAKKIRTSHLNYAYYAQPVVNPKLELALTDLLGDDYLFKIATGVLTVKVNNGEEKIIPADNIVINDLKFFINPTSNPFTTLDIPPTSHPYITVVMDVSASKAGQTANLIIQQTIPQRSGQEPE
ncbi:MAG TPA: prepilin-type N-terminal cleavage/methylation domain-containing protein [bacterium]|nr:prepilin-type N-terminal cleavage/methylation domain-containing protein [bacterium]